MLMCQVNDSLVNSMTLVSSPTLRTGECGPWFGASFRTCHGGWGSETLVGTKGAQGAPGHCQVIILCWSQRLLHWANLLWEYVASDKPPPHLAPLGAPVLLHGQIGVVMSAELCSGLNCSLALSTFWPPLFVEGESLALTRDCRSKAFSM